MPLLLDLMRKNTNSWTTYLLFAAIIVVFIFTFGAVTPDQACGGAQNASGPNLELATIGDHTIDTKLHRLAAELTPNPPRANSNSSRAFQAEQRYLTGRLSELPLRRAYAGYGQDPTEISPMEFIKAMEDLEETLLVAGVGEAHDMTSSNLLLQRRLAGYFFDAKTKEFNPQRWQRWVRSYFGVSPKKFEWFCKQELLREQVITLLVGGAILPKPELEYIHNSTGAKVDLELVRIDTDTAAKLAKVDNAARTTWLANKDNAKAVSDYFEADKDKEFTKPERAVVRGIYIDAPNLAQIASEKDETKKQATLKQRDAAKAKAAALLTTLSTKQDAADAAAKAKKAAEAAKDEATATGDGADKDAAAADADKATAAAAVPSALAKDRAIDAEVFGEVAKTESKHSGSKYQGGLFEAKSAKELANYPFGKDVAAAVMTLKPGQITGAIEVPSGYWVLRLDEKLPAFEKTLDQVRDEIANRLIAKEKGEKLKKSLADELLASAKASTDKTLDALVESLNTKYGAASGEGLTSTTTGPFAQMGANGGYGRVPAIGARGGADNAKITRAAFAATDKAPVLGEVFEQDDAFIVARLKTQEEAGEFDLDSLRDQQENRLAARKALFYRAWYEDLRAKSLADKSFVRNENWETLEGQLLDELAKATKQAEKAKAKKAATEEKTDAETPKDDKAKKDSKPAPKKADAPKP